MIDWDSIISFAIIGGFILTLWAKVAGQTVGELLRDFIELIRETKEEQEEVLAYYE